MWFLLELLVSKELISYPRPGNDNVLYSDEVVVGRFLNEKDVLSGGYSGMGKLGDCHSNQNAGGTLDVEVIGMLFGNFFWKTLKIPIF